MNKGNQKGITLIALIITIIVILILVAVTVSTAANSGLFDHAKDATNKWADEQDKESNIGDEVNKLIDENVQTNKEKTVKFSLTRNGRSDGEFEVQKGTTWLEFFSNHLEDLADYSFSIESRELHTFDADYSSWAYFYQIVDELGNTVIVDNPIKNGNYSNSGKRVGFQRWCGLFRRFHLVIIGKIFLVHK